MFLVVADVDSFGEGMGAHTCGWDDALAIDGVYGGVAGGIGDRCGRYGDDGGGGRGVYGEGA